MEKFRNFISRYGLYTFGGFMALLFMTVIANGTPVQPKEGWKQDVPYHCVPTRFENNEEAMNFLFGQVKFKNGIKDGTVVITEQTDTLLALSMDLKKNGQHNDIMRYTYSPFKICIQGFVKDAKEA